MNDPKFNIVHTSGGSVVSNNIVTGKGRLKWCIREEPVNAVDNGWRFISDIDTDEFLSSPDNMQILAWESVVNIEPAVMALIDLPVGSDLTLVVKETIYHFYDTESGCLVV